MVKKKKKNRVGGGTVPKNAHPHSASTDGVSIAIHYHHEEAPALLSSDELEQEWLKKVKVVIGEKWLVEGGGQVGKISSSSQKERRKECCACECLFVQACIHMLHKTHCV